MGTTGMMGQWELRNVELTQASHLLTHLLQKRKAHVGIMAILVEFEWMAFMVQLLYTLHYHLHLR